MSATTLDQPLPVTFGLEPRYFRLRAEQEALATRIAAAAAAEEALAAERARELAWQELAGLHAVDEATPLLRQRVLDAKVDEPKRFPLRITLPLAVGVAGFLWLGLIEVVHAASRLLTML